MKKIILKGDGGVKVSDIIKGAIIGTGVGVIALGVLSIVKSAKKKKEVDSDDFDDATYQEFVEEKKKKIRRDKNVALGVGIFNIITGLTFVAVAIVAFMRPDRKIKKKMIELTDTAKEELAKKAKEEIAKKINKEINISVSDVIDKVPCVKDKITEVLLKDAA